MPDALDLSPLDAPTKRALRDAMWAGDLAALDDLAPCRCCCDEHTFPGCLARLWGGCRSGLPYGDDGTDERAWAEHYATHHGLTQAQFYGDQA